jgi:hypothetical protein
MRRCRIGRAPDVARVDQQALKVVFKDCPRRLPIDAGGLHDDLLHPVRAQPVAQHQQPAHRRGELRDPFRAPAAVV